MKNNNRLLRWFVFFSSVFVLIASFYFQYMKGLQPCPLCIMQRICVLLIVIFAFVLILIKNNKLWQKFNMAQLIVSVAGLFFALRQLWLQSLPADQIPACLPGLDILIQYFPWKDVFHALFWGSGDCAEVNWQWLGLSMPAWSALYFVVILVSSLLNRYYFRKLP